MAGMEREGKKWSLLRPGEEFRENLEDRGMRTAVMYEEYKQKWERKLLDISL